MRYLVGLMASAALLAMPVLASAQTAPHHGTPHAKPASGLSAERMARLSALLKAYVDQGRIAGAVVQIQQDGRTVYADAVGWRDKEARDPMRQDTIFRIASQTKALTSVAILMLMEEGKLLLSDPVGNYLPAWSKTTVAVANDKGGYDVVPAKRAITIRDLLTHTAGISYGNGPAEKAWRDAGIFGWYFADRNEPVADVVARMAALPMAEQPGTKFVYGYSTDILGVLVEKISGQKLDAFLNERLIGPLGMRDTSFYLPPAKAGRLATVSGQMGRRRSGRAGPLSAGAARRAVGRGGAVVDGGRL
jgi:CubicO group peptidase (beta-lactamase class C family)